MKTFGPDSQLKDSTPEELAQLPPDQFNELMRRHVTDPETGDLELSATDPFIPVADH